MIMNIGKIHASFNLDCNNIPQAGWCHFFLNPDIRVGRKTDQHTPTSCVFNLDQLWPGTMVACATIAEIASNSLTIPAVLSYVVAAA